MRHLRVAVLVTLAAAAAGCSANVHPTAASATTSRAGNTLVTTTTAIPTTTTAIPTTTTAIPTTTTAIPTTTTAIPTTTTTTATTTTMSTPAGLPAFRSTVEHIEPVIAARMTASWRPGCPIRLEELRLLTVTHWGFDGQQRQGELVVHAGFADDIVSVFRRLHYARFPIEQLRLVDEFGGDDDQSMAANNTSAFNCRRATGSDRWSEHAYGRAIDINPIQNPYVTRSGAVLPPAGAAHTTRDPATAGLITGDGPVVAAFRAIGWRWGGTWSSGKDYQHFSATGR